MLSLLLQIKEWAPEKIDLRFIDTTSKCSHGSFQIVEEGKKSWDHLKMNKLKRKKELNICNRLYS